MSHRLCLSLLLLFAVLAPTSAAPKPTSFGVAAHNNVNIEWWYVNAHVTTAQGRHLALIGSFFRFGNGTSPLNPFEAAPRAHYLIYAVTDLDAKTQRSYSLADTNMVALLRQIAPLLAATNPHDKGAKALLSSLFQGKLPPGNQEIAGPASVVSAPFHLAYGTDNTLTSDNTANTSFTLNLGSGSADKIHLTLTSQKPPMAVGGKGETGLQKPTDMYYYSLTRCAVSGEIDTGTGPEKITSGLGWFDHQWGNSWVASNDGWDWWGVQLTNGTDILFFRQRDLATGKVFFPLATFMDKNGHQSVTKDIVFTPDSHSYWTSPKSGVTYPLAWTVTFPAKNLQLHITAAVKDQEMQILGPGSGIWEGSCNVTASPLQTMIITADIETTPQGSAKAIAAQEQQELHEESQQQNPPVPGVAYMELVGYNSPAVRAQVAKKRSGVK
jgi:predicted secreted hydrolase